MAIKNDTEKSKLLSELNSAKIINTSSNIVKKAANILEEEIAKGIIFAQKIEKKFVDVEKLRSGDTANVMPRLRKDVNEAVNIIFDAFEVAINALNNVTEKLISVTEETTSPPTNSPQAAKSSLPVLQAPESLKPGGKASIPLLLENESPDKEMAIEFQVNNLSSVEGNKISSRNIKLNPKVLKLKPKEKGEVKIELSIPKSAKSGTYSGMIQGKDLPNLKAMIVTVVV